MKKLIQYVERFDQFGVMFQLASQNNDVMYKSVYGGLVSFIIYITGFMYFVYLFWIWQTRQIPPSVTQQIKQSQNGQGLNFTNTAFILSVHVDNPTPDFDEYSNLFYVDGAYYGLNSSIGNLSVDTKEDNCGFASQLEDYYSPVCQNMKDQVQTWLYEDNSRVSDVYLSYQILYCNPETDLHCISEENKTILFQSGAYWRLTTIIQDVDLQTGVISNIQAEYYYQMDHYMASPLYFQLKITKATILVDEGIIFANYRIFDIVKDVQISVTQIPAKPSLGPSVLLSLEKYFYVIEIRYPKLAEILANLGSVIQTLLLSGFLLNKLNRRLQEAKIKDSLIQLYFPQFKQYVIKKDLYQRKIISVMKNGQALEGQRFENFTSVYYSLFANMHQKFNHLHILHEINKLQIGLSMILPRKHIRLIQQINYTISSEKRQRSMSFFPSASQRNPDEVIDQEDFLALQYTNSDVSNYYDLETSTNFRKGRYQGLFQELVYDKIIDHIVFQNSESTRRCISLLT